MDSLFIYEKDHCTCKNLNQVTTYNSYSIHKEGNLCLLDCGEKTVQVHRNSSIQLDSVHFLYVEENWTKKELIEMDIGRDPNCTLSFALPLLSNRHARLYKEEAWILEDCQSRNGTYCNGKRILKQSLKLGDEICMANLRIFFFDDFILVNQAIQSDFKYKFVCDLPIHLWKAKEEQIEMQSLSMDLDVELPIASYQAKKPNVLTSIASSLSIFLSSVSLALITYILNRDKLEQVQTMLMTSGSMFIAFLCYGLWTHFHRLKEINQDLEKRKESYLSYLNHLNEKVWMKRQAFMKQEEENKALCLQFDERTFGVSHPLWMGWYLSNWITIHCSKVSYMQQEDDLVKQCISYQNEWIQTIRKNKFVEMNTLNVVENKQEDMGVLLFLQWIWQKPSSSCKWVWIDPLLSCMDRRFSLPYCQQGTLRLLAKDKKEWDVLKKQLDLSFEYIVCSRIKDCSWQEKCTWIYLPNTQNKASNFQVLLRSYLEHTSEVVIDSSSYFQKLSWSKELCLKVPIGQVHGEILEMDFSDGQQGPHGIVAGMTGSGKSEWLSSVLMQLILRNDPDYLEYILIDFKGGAFGQSFYTYPHCVGMVTNLDNRAIDRWMLSMNAEILKRQKKMNAFIKKHPNQIAHIDVFNQHSTKPLSHLFVIFDEYAEFKSQYPDYAYRVKEMARIGRSLGIHLLICTQKPMGVIDEQIWSNSSFQVCLKVNSEADSREVIHDVRAAHLKNPGEFILRCDQRILEGRGFYLHERIFDSKHANWKEFDLQNQVIDSCQLNCKTIFQNCSEMIEAHNRQHHWVLYPDLNKELSMDSFIKIDDPKNQRQIDFEIQKGMNVFVYWERKEELDCFVKSFISRYQEEVILCVGMTGYEDYVDGTMESLDCFEEGSVLVNCESKENFQELNHSKVRMIYLIHKPWLSLHQMNASNSIYISLSWTNVDFIRLFFNEMKIPKVKENTNFGLIQMNQSLLYFMYPNRVPVYLEQKRIQFNDLYILGKEYISNRPIVWKRDNPLLILFVQMSCEVWIQKKCAEFLELDPMLSIRSDFNQLADIYLIHMQEAVNLFESPLYLDYQYDFDILWVGRGLSDFSYLLKRKCPYQLNGNMVYWSNEGIYELMYA